MTLFGAAGLHTIGLPGLKLGLLIRRQIHAVEFNARHSFLLNCAFRATRLLSLHVCKNRARRQRSRRYQRRTCYFDHGKLSDKIEQDPFILCALTAQSLTPLFCPATLERKEEQDSSAKTKN